MACNPVEVKTLSVEDKVNWIDQQKDLQERTIDQGFPISESDEFYEEGPRVKAFYRNDTLFKVMEENITAMHQTTTSYYYYEGSLFFVKYVQEQATFDSTSTGFDFNRLEEISKTELQLTDMKIVDRHDSGDSTYLFQRKLQKDSLFRTPDHLQNLIKKTP